MATFTEVADLLVIERGKDARVRLVLMEVVDASRTSRYVTLVTEKSGSGDVWLKDKAVNLRKGELEPLAQAFGRGLESWGAVAGVVTNAEYARQLPWGRSFG